MTTRVTLLTGFPYVALTIVIPERFQIVNGENALMASLHILPLLGACATGSFFGGAISSKRNNTSITLMLASCLQLLGVGLMMLITSEKTGAAEQYAFQAIFGVGVGLSFSAATIMTNIMASASNERASAQGAVAQARVLGGCIGLSVCTVIFNAHVNKSLNNRLSAQELQNLHRTPLSALQLPPEKQMLIKGVYSEAFREEIRTMTLICVAMVFVSLFTLERHPAPLERLTQMAKDEPASSRGSESGTELGDTTNLQQQT
jgi:MFS family permease